MEYDAMTAEEWRAFGLRCLDHGGFYEPLDDEIVLQEYYWFGLGSAGPSDSAARGMTLREAKERWPNVLVWAMKKGSQK